MLLSNLGAEVIKVENKNFRDPFSLPSIEEHDPSFITWYKAINKDKKIISMNFGSTAHQEELRKLILRSDAIILGIPKKYREGTSISEIEIQNLSHPLAILELKGSRDEEAMHDINALARTSLLSLYTANETTEILNPPFIPTAGISFGYHIAVKLLAMILKARAAISVVHDDIYLDETVRELTNAVYPSDIRDQDEKLFLHNGLFPCYSLYLNKDKRYVAVATIEKKFWNVFISELGLPLKEQDRFSKDHKIKEMIAKKITNMTSLEINERLVSKKICISLA